MNKSFFAAFWLVCLLGGLSGCSTRKPIWIYTSLPKEVIAEMVGPLEAAVPEADVKWYQAGSDSVEGRLNTELEKGKVKADLVLAGDPLWYLEMKRDEQLLTYASPAAKEVPAGFADPDHAFSIVRLSLVVMGYSNTAYRAEDLPQNWKDLLAPRFTRKVSMANPLDSTAAFVATALLSKELGWDYFAGLRQRGLMAEGTNGSVAARIDSEERPLGILPLESIARLAKSKPHLKAYYPLDGAVPVPGPIAILKSSRHPEIAKKVYDWFFGQQAQGTLVRAGSYSALPQFAPPEGGRPWNTLVLKKWNPQELSALLLERDRIRAKFSTVVLH